MPLAGMRLVRQVLGENLPPGWTVAQAQMDYVHADNVEWQVLTFHVNDPKGEQHVLTSERVPARDDINELTVKTAKRFAEGLKNAQASAPGAAPDSGGPTSNGDKTLPS
jgi:hypothetical protein